ncbi:TIGR03016 family PEP-CTERM system-associated outer membrane protein [Thalassotalea sediminis]|uniref:TIGR03016 family PEP-CTERM system-associated outer membrane protein n=1 Tax=Thalassotalea sediminis TaxID=1759089 RepID=UPI002574312A|nr:TIGR03016 family PEP-CTERM system-associated outer membrane protein [Thalassotalea sediminis]
MATMVMDMAKANKITIILYTSLISHAAVAGEWLFTPTLTLDETYTDNVELISGNETSSLVTQAGIDIDTSYHSQLVQFNLYSSSLNAFYSHDHELDDDYHKLNSDINVKLGDYGLSLFGSANIDYRARNNARNALANIVSADLAQIKSYSGGLAYNVNNSDFNIASSLAYNLVESEDNIGDQEGYSVNLSSKNGHAARLLFWDTQGSYRERKRNGRSSRLYQGELKLGLISDWKINPFIRYYDEDNKGSIGSNRSIESNAYGLGVRWLVTPRLQLDLSYNTPIGESVDIDGKEQDDYIDAKVEWQPSIRTTLSANYSQRFFGDSYGFNFSHKNKRLTNTISYNEEVQSFTRDSFVAVDYGSYWCPTSGGTDFNDCFVENDSNVDFDNYTLIRLTDLELVEDDVLSLNKTLSWSSTLSLSRTTLKLGANYNNRENLETRIEDERKAISFSVSRDVSGRSDINFKASYTDNHFLKDTSNTRRDRYRQFSIGYKKSLNPTVSFNIDLASVNRSSSNEQYNYDEGRVTFKITKDF